MPNLFSPVTVGALTLPNRILMAPLTRCRADADHAPVPLIAEYYAQRASAGLIIAEATMAMAGNSAFWMKPGIYCAAQVAGWKLTTTAVHAAGGRIFLQLWHGGRACHPLLNGGIQPVAPSPLPIIGDEVHTPEGKQPYQADEANAAIEAGLVDAVAFGTGFLANPDLPARIKAGAPLNSPNPATFYSPGPEGYTDYPFMS